MGQFDRRKIFMKKASLLAMIGIQGFSGAGLVQCSAAEKETMVWETPSGISSDTIEERMDEVFEKYIGKNVEGAAVAVVKNGEIVFEKGFGYADEANNKRVIPEETVFEYGSVTKLFTWVSAMQLSEAGKLDLNENITNYLPEDFEVPHSYDTPITMLNLMNHTAGFDDYGIGLFTRQDNYTDLRTSLEEHKVMQVNEPGSICSYSNYGAGLAGYLVQNVAQEEEYQYVREHIFDVLGMNQVTLSFSNDSQVDLSEQKSKGYTIDEDGNLVEGEWTYIPMYPAGESNGTVEELAKFGIGLLDKESGLFQSPETYDELLSTTYTANEEIAGVSHGFFEYDGEYKTYWHNGGTNDFSTFFAVVPEADFAIAVVANTEGSPCNRLVHEIGWMSVGVKQVELEKPEENLPDTKDVVGTYTAPRRFHHGISQLIYLFSMNDVTVDYLNENEITIDGTNYLQIKPYLYQDEETGQKCFFTVENGEVTAYTYIQGYEKDKISSKLFYWSSYGVIAIWLVTFVVVIPLLIIMFCKKRGAGYHSILYSELLWIGLLVNIVSIALKILDAGRFGAIQVQLVINIILGILLAGLSLYQLIKMNHQTMCSRKSRNFIRYYSIVNVLMLVILFLWGVFNPVA